MLSADTLEILVRAGLSGEALLAAVRAMEADMIAALPKRSTNADRQARYRERKASLRYAQSDDQGVTDVTDTRYAQRDAQRDNTTPSLETKVPTPLKTQTLSPKENPLRGQKKGDGEAFERFRAAYPPRLGSNPWQPAREKFDRAVKAGADAERIIAGAMGYAAEQARLGKVGSEFIMQAKAWLNQNCWQDYADQIVEASNMIPKLDPRWPILVARWERENGKRFPSLAEKWPFPGAWLTEMNGAHPEGLRP